MFNGQILKVISLAPFIHPPAGQLITFFDINTILIATNPIANKAIDMLLEMKYFFKYKIAAIYKL